MHAPARTAAACLLATSSMLAFPPAARADDAPARMLLGAYVDGREVGSFEVLREGAAFLVPLEALAQISGSRVEYVAPGTTRLTTPIGSTELGPDDVRVIDGVTYVGQDLLEARLATAVRFDSEEYAIHFSLPWSRERAPAERPAAPIADVGPPRATLSTLRQDLRYTLIDETRDGFSSTTLGGTVHGGYWRARFEDDLDGERRLRDYAWRRAFGNHLVLAGQQTVQLHPLLGGFELTGLQAAWTNQALDPLSRDAEIRELVPRRIRPSATFSGPAPPGSLAELRVDGVRVDEQMTGLDGRYDFPEVHLSARQLTRVEVRVYDRRDPIAPLAIHEHTQSASEFLLPAGAVVHLGGLGREGNLADATLGQEQSDDPVLFYQWRRGLSPRVTLESAVQEASGARQVQAGIVSRLGAGFVASLGLALSRSDVGYGLDVDGRGRRFRLSASSQIRSRGFFAGDARALSDHAAEFWVRLAERFELGLLGRHREDAVDDVDFLRPAISWNPLDRLTLRALPNHGGDYRLLAGYRVTDRDDLHWTTEEDTYVDFVHRFDDAYRIDLTAELGGDGVRRQAAILHRLGSTPRAPSFSLGVATNGERVGARASIALPLLPGVLARVDYQGAGTSFGEEDGALTLALTADLTLAHRRLLPADSGSIRVDEGAIAGRVRLPGGSGETIAALADVRVLVDGRIGTRTDRRGYFFIGGLAEGVHVVELDAEHLPLELVPERGTLTVRVVAGASTRADFALHAEYGLSGRVTDARGVALPFVHVELSDPAGRRVAGAETDRFGRFRLDGLRVGDYVLSAPAADGAPATAARQARVVDTFLFDQDLVRPDPAR